MVLKDQGDRPLGGGKRSEIASVEQQATRGRLLEAGDQMQKRRLAAAGWSDDGAKLTPRNREAVTRLEPRIGEPAIFNQQHQRTDPTRRRARGR